MFANLLFNRQRPSPNVPRSRHLDLETLEDRLAPCASMGLERPVMAADWSRLPAAHVGEIARGHHGKQYHHASHAAFEPGRQRHGDAGGNDGEHHSRGAHHAVISAYRYHPCQSCGEEIPQ